MIRPCSLALLLAAVLAFSTESASALTIRFDGTVSSEINFGPPSGLVGEAWSATITYDENHGDELPAIPEIGLYNLGLIAYDVTVGANTWTYDSIPFLRVDHFPASNDFLQYEAIVFGPDIGTGDTTPRIGVFLNDTSATAHSSDALLVSAPTLADYNQLTAQLDFFDSVGDLSRLVLTIDSAITVVPEPSTALLFGLGLIGIAYRKRRSIGSSCSVVGRSDN